MYKNHFKPSKTTILKGNSIVLKTTDGFLSNGYVAIKEGALDMYNKKLLITFKNDRRYTEKDTPNMLEVVGEVSEYNQEVVPNKIVDVLDEPATELKNAKLAIKVNPYYLALFEDFSCKYLIKNTASLVLVCFDDDIIGVIAPIIK